MASKVIKMLITKKCIFPFLKFSSIRKLKRKGKKINNAPAEI